MQKFSLLQSKILKLNILLVVCFSIACTSTKPAAQVEPTLTLSVTNQESLTTKNPESTATLTPISVPTTLPSKETPTPETSFLNGPLIGFRGNDGENDLLVILDINVADYRILNADTSHPFGQLWFGNGCELYVGNGLVNLKGELVWEKPNLDWTQLLPQEGAFSKTMLLSSDKQWMAYDILYGEQFFEDSEFQDLGIINLSDPTSPIFLTNDGRTNRYSWSPNDIWLAYKHVDQSGTPQLFRFSPNSNETEQLTFHTDRMGIGYIIWSPNGRYIAYAGYQSNDQGETGVGWVDIVDVQTLNLWRIAPPEENFGGVHGDEIWWSQDETTLLISGRDWQNLASSTQIYWVDVSNQTITDSFFASEAPEKRIDELYAVGSTERILFSVNNEFYLLNASDKSYEPIPFNPNILGQRYESESAPFNFPGEANCQN